jgi:hypothetical protein
MQKTNNIFKISLLDGWKDKTIFTFEGPIDSGVQHNIVLVIDDTLESKTDLQEYVKSQMMVSKEALPGFEMISEKEKVLGSGIKGYEVVYKYMPKDDQALFQKQFYTIISDKAYIFTSTFSKETLQTISLDVDTIIGSLTPLNLEE